MCGIAGYIGAKKAQPILLEILRRVEYRGYDSAGIATRRPVDGFNLCRETGKLKKLEEALEARPLSGTTGIGHTRWATHGDQATVQNAHPHITGRVALVHNGTIENYLELKSDLEKLGFTFQSQTDTEVISALVSRYLPDSVNPLEATRRALQRLKGSYALCIMFDVDGYNYLVVARNKSPLIIGFATDGTYVASDVDALAGYVDKVIYLGDEEYGIVGQKGYGFYNLAGMPVQHTTIPVTVQNSEVSKGNYKHWMQKEILVTRKNTLSGFGTSCSTTPRMIS